MMFFQSCWVAFLCGLNLSLGALAVLMIYSLTGGSWGRALHAPLAAAARLMPLHALIFLLLLPGMPALYSWWPGHGALDPLLQEAIREKSWWLDQWFFLLRAAIYFGVWIGLSWRWTALARRLGATAPALKRVSAAGLLLYAFTVWLSGIDWIMSLEPRWYSSGFGLLLGTSQVLAALAFGVLIVTLDARSSPQSRLEPQTYNDLGNLLLMAVLLWMYLAFTQFLIVWAEDLPNETVWYLPRVTTSWRRLTILIVVFQFALPFLLLLSRAVKREPRRLAALAALTLGASLVYVFYLVVPTLEPAGFVLRPADVLWMAAAAALWIALWSRTLARGRSHA